MEAPVRNWRTAVREIRDRYRRATASEEAIQRSLCEAAEFLQSNDLWFKVGRFSMVTAAGTARYPRGSGAGTVAGVVHQGLPTDFEGFPEDLECWPLGTESAKTPIRAVTREYAELDGPDWTASEFWSNAQQGRPTAFAWSAEELIFSPVPSLSTDVVTGLYVRALGVPFALFDGTDWQFYKPDGSPMDNTYPSATSGEFNAWFAEGYHLLKQRASFILNYQYLDDEAEANAALAMFGEEEQRLRSQGVRQQRGYIRPWL